MAEEQAQARSRRIDQRPEKTDMSAASTSRTRHAAVTVDERDLDTSTTPQVEAAVRRSNVMRLLSRARPDQAFLLFAVAFFVLHQAWFVLTTPGAEGVVGVVTPFAVVAAGVLVLYALRASWVSVAVAVVAATTYVLGRGAHLAADAIQREIDAGIVTFWDERFSHVVGVLGWCGLLAAFCLAEQRRSERWTGSPRVLAAAALTTGWTAAVATIEGQTWWLELLITGAFVAWAVRDPRPLLRSVAAAFVVGAALIAAWAVWHGGVPEITAV